ncbi:MAG: ribonuclease D, partial [Rhodobacteraceae bacterium]|nr:ribonuclease D [Paracoccaceae bacterium]
MKVISTNQELAELCKKANNKPYIALDTEFVSEKTYFPKLCLIQVALPECDESDGSEFIIDTLNPKLKLDNLIPIFQNQKITKVL